MLGRFSRATGTYLGLTYHDEKCAGSPGDTRRLLDALAQQPPAGGGGGAPLCARARLDFHVTPDARGVPELVATVANLSNIIADGPPECAGLKLVIFEQNMCSGGERFERALADAGALATLSALAGRIEAAASSQAWTAAAHYDGCGEGHIAALPGLWWPLPPYHALAMTFNSYLPIALAPECDRDEPAAGANLTLAAATAAADAPNQADVALRVVNPDNATVAVPVRFEAAAPLPYTACSATAVTLSSPLAGDADAYAAERGGWNPPDDPGFIAPSPPVAVPCAANASALVLEYAFPPLSYVVLNVSAWVA